MVGVGAYSVTVEMADSGGIFTNAEVTYLGVPAGRVGALRLTKSGVSVELVLDSVGPQIPDSATAVVANRSAIGEQFVDLQPSTTSGPYLHDGSVIERFELPRPLEDVVSSALDFADSIPVEDLRTVVTELGNAFSGQGENLTRLVTSLSNLSRRRRQHFGDRRPALQCRVRARHAGRCAILSWSHSIDLITAQLASSDPDVRRLLSTGTASASQLSALIDRHGGDMTAVVHDLGETLRTIAPTSYAVAPTFAMLSQLSASSHATAPGDGQIHFGVVLETNNPSACTRGYESTQRMIDEMRRRNPSFDLRYDDFPFNTAAACTVPQGNPTSVRGAARAPYANPRIAQPWDTTPKRDPDRLDLNPLARQLAALMGVPAR